MSAHSISDQTLVVLLENNGIDLKLDSLIRKILFAIPGSSLIPEYVIRAATTYLEQAIKRVTDHLLESADLLLNRFQSAVPEHYGEVIILRDGTASDVDLKDTLIRLTGEGKTIDLFILTHGSNNFISVRGGINGTTIRDIKTENGNHALALRAVYMMNCVGSSLNQPWLDIGAKVVSGSKRNNYLPEPSMYFFWNNWKGGQSFQHAVTDAYDDTIDCLEGTLLAGNPLLSTLVDVRNQDFVKDSEPVIQGQGTVKINSAV